MGRLRKPLPLVPLHILSKQQRIVYKLSADYSTAEIAKELSIPEKQVRQVYSAIRSKSRDFANKTVSTVTGAEPVHYSPSEEGRPNYDSIREIAENNGLECLSSNELYIMEQLNMGISILDISRLSGKSIQSVQKTYQRAKRKLCQKNDIYVDNFTTKIDTGNTYVRINPGIIRAAIEGMDLSIRQAGEKTGIRPERMLEIISCGNVSYDELFQLIKHLKINPYGPSEKDDLLKKLNDTQWIRMIRSGTAEGGGRCFIDNMYKRIKVDKSRYRNRVLYYSTSYYRYNALNRERPIVQNGRSGLFPLELTRNQQAECGWLLKKLMLRPVYKYRHTGLAREIALLEGRLNDETDENRAERFRREIVHLREDIVPEDGRAIFIINKDQFFAINRILFEPSVCMKEGD